MWSIFDKGYHRSILINIQCSNFDDALQASKRFSGTLVGVMAKSFFHLQQGIAFAHQLRDAGIMVSAGLGDGCPNQWERALKLALNARTEHLNQVFPVAALSQKALEQAGVDTCVNALIRPSGRPGLVNISTGPFSEQAAEAIIPGETAAAMLSEAGVRSLKFFPMEGTKALPEAIALAKAAARYDMILEPTVGLTPENVGPIVAALLDAGVTHIIPHLYGSLKDATTGNLDIGRFEKAVAAIETHA